MIDEIEIVEYKGFKNLKLENLSQINIISGENNIGKTALLEALFIYENIALEYELCKDFISLSLQPLLVIAKNRDITESRIKKYLKDISILIRDNKTELKVDYKLSLFLTKKEKIYIKENFNQDYDEFLVCYVNNDLYILPINNINLGDIDFNNYINSSKPTNKKLVKLYSNIQSKGIQHKFLNYLKLLDNDIEWIEQFH